MMIYFLISFWNIENSDVSKNTIRELDGKPFLSKPDYNMLYEKAKEVIAQSLKSHQGNVISFKEENNVRLIK